MRTPSVIVTWSLTAIFATAVAVPASAKVIRPAAPLPTTHNCENATIRMLTTRLADMDPKTGKTIPQPDSGFQVTFTGRLPDPYAGSLKPAVVFYQGDPTNAYVARERVGDRVQVCAIGFPSVGAAGEGPAGSCDPTKDTRGRTLRVFDVLRGFAYTGPNSEHDCGGA